MSEKRTVRFDARTLRSQGHRGEVNVGTTDRPWMRNIWPTRHGDLASRWKLDASSGQLPTAEYSTEADTVLPVQNSAGFEYNDQDFDQDFLTVGNNGTYVYAFSDSTAADSEDSTLRGTSPWASRISPDTWLYGGLIISTAVALPASPVPVSITDVRSPWITAFGLGGTSFIVGSTVHQGRAFYWGYDFSGSGAYGAQNRVYYSDAYDYDTFTSAEQFFDIDGQVRGMVSLGGQLIIWDSGGRYYLLQGRGDPAVATLNTLGIQPIPPYGYQPAIMDDRAYFVEASGERVCILNGAGIVDDVSLAHLRLPFSNPAKPIASSTSNLLILPDQGNKALVLYDEMWTLLEFDESVIGGLDDPLYLIDDGNGEIVVLNWNSGDTTYDRYDIPFRVTTPDFSLSTETMTATLGLPRLFAPDHNIRIERVYVDARIHAGLNYAPALDVRVTTSSTRSGSGGLLNDPQNFPNDGVGTSLTAAPSDRISELVSEASPSNVIEVDRRFVFTAPPLGFAEWHDIYLDFDGLSIMSVQVEFTVSKGPTL